MNKLIILCLFLGACSQGVSTEEPLEVTPSTIEFSGVTTTTILQETTTT